MASESRYSATMERSISGQSPSVSLHERSDSLSQPQAGSRSSLSRLSSSGIELDKLRLSLEDAKENGHHGQSPKPNSSRPSSAAEPSLSKPPIGSGKHRRAISSISLQKLEIPENGGHTDRTSPSPYTVSNGRSRSGSFSHLDIPRTDSPKKRSLDESRDGRRTYTWDEKGKGVAYQSERRSMRSKRISNSQASSRASSPRSVRIGPPSSRAGSPHRRSFSSSSINWQSSVASRDREEKEEYLQEQLRKLKEDLAGSSAKQKIGCLRKVQLDSLLCKRVADDEIAVAAIVRCMEPARTWLPQVVGCTDLQFHAVIACKHLASHPQARSKIAGSKGIPALVQLLKSGSLEAQSHTARALAYFAEDSLYSFQIGQGGGCAALVGMLPTRTGLQNSFMSVEMAVDHEAAQANAALALANLAGATGNQQKMVEAGAINSLLLCLSPGILAATQASAAKCLHKLAKDEEYLEIIHKAGALQALLNLLEAEDTECTPLAAAAEAVGGIINGDKTAAETIPYLVGLMGAEPLKVKLAATRALSDLASKSKFNRTKIAEEPNCIPHALDQLRLAEAQQALAHKIQVRCMRSSGVSLTARLRDFLGDQTLRAIQTMLQQLDMTLNNKMDSETLVKVFRENALNHQRAAVRLLQSLSLRGFSQSRVDQSRQEVVKRVPKLLRSEVVSIRAKALSCLASLAAHYPRLVQSGVESMALVDALQARETKSHALRLLLNLATDDTVLKNLVNIGIVPVVIDSLTSKSQDIQFLASSCLANMTGDETCRDLIMETSGLDSLCKILFTDNLRALGPAAQTLWQLIEDSSQGPKIAQSIQSLGGHRGAVHILNVEDSDVREQGTALIASLAKCDRDTAELLAREGATGHMILLARDSSASVKANALEALTYLAAASDHARQMILGPSGDSVDIIIKQMDSTDHHLRMRAASCLASLSVSPELASLLDERGFISRLIKFLLESRSAQERRAAIRALSKHATHSLVFAREFDRLGGLDLLDGLRDLLPDERGLIAQSLQSIASGPNTPKDNDEEKYDQFVENLPVMTT